MGKDRKEARELHGRQNTSIARSHSSTEPPGDDNFLADTAHRNTMSYDFFEGENTPLTGNAKRLNDLVEGDVFRASVTVLGKIDYDTQIGGNTSHRVAVLSRCHTRSS
jgi:hypothetical protein